MKRHHFIVLTLVFCVLGLCLPDAVRAVTVTAPGTGSVQQPVTVTVNSQYNATGMCPIQVNFGDGSPWVDAGTCMTFDCTLTATHTYTAPGTYIITARSNGCFEPPLPPDPATATITIEAAAAAVTVRTTPDALAVSRNAVTSRQVLYQASSIPPATATLLSGQGIFYAGNTAVGTVDIPLRLPLVSGLGQVSETLVIPVAVQKRAEALGRSQITYTRTFTNGSLTAVPFIPITVTTQAGAGFALTGMRLFFDNHRAEVTLGRHRPLPPLFAEISFAGSGLLEGYWEIDGKRLAPVTRHLDAGGAVTLAAPDYPVFPTHNPGTHRIRLVVTRPDTPMDEPVAVYFVTPDDAGAAGALTLIAPKDGSGIERDGTVFRWEGGRGAHAYRITFEEPSGEEPVFNAYTKDSVYTLPAAALAHHFRPAHTYLWSVTALDEGGAALGQSAPFTFHYDGPAEHRPGYLLIILKNDDAARDAVNGLALKYGLLLSEQMVLASIDRRVLVCETTQPLSGVINALKGVPVIEDVQPDYLFKTLADPLKAMQEALTPLDLSAVHTVVTGKGVKVAVIDTGVDAAHEDLKTRIIASENLVPGQSEKAEIHGTGVAGIIAASVNGFGIEGVAPGVTVIALRACRQLSDDRPEGECYSSSIARALDRAIAAGADIVNMSFGAVVHDRLIAALLEKGAERGMAFVAPAGNDRAMGTLGFPAGHPAVLAVSGTDGRGNPYPCAALCGKADVSAPAVNVFTATPGNSHNFMTGTSLSSAIVSGILALAAERGTSIRIKDLPSYEGSIQRWQATLLELPVCDGDGGL
ncbi:hypothetical protein JCM14469_03390 [Desulfatiferula olefinivorans]